jgi:methylated-DNA-[protein]-cysteine S-methyltransferase
MHLLLARYAAPIAELQIVTDEDGTLRGLDFENHDGRLHRLLRVHYGEVSIENGVAPRAIVRALDAYFKGDLKAIDTLPVATDGTSFQREVWKILRTIPAGETRSYGQLAAAIGRAAACRAVGAANGANPVGIVVPCHRVIGANGKLTGYGGGLPNKEWLLDHERKFAASKSSRKGASAELVRA